ncbi:MAG: 4Fe-4S dicluster domain-containing protein [Chloroflexi bacterium]|nr:4Fe-4S dicluster domain-containing protein [Chloroflexota bacterium]
MKLPGHVNYVHKIAIWSIIIDRDVCVGCGRCEAFCPMDALPAMGAVDNQL